MSGPEYPSSPGPDDPTDPPRPYGDPGGPVDPNPQGGYGGPGGYEQGQAWYGTPPAGPGARHDPPGRPGATLVARLGERALHRARPRLGTTLAGLGVGVTFVGLVIWGTSYTTLSAVSAISDGGSFDGATSSHHYLVALLSFLVTVAGAVLAVRAPRGPLTTAGIGLVALGVPITVQYLTQSSSLVPTGDVDAVYWISVLTYLVCYLAVPGMRGHTIFLGVTLFLTWSYVLQTVVPSAATGLGSFAGRFVPSAAATPATSVNSTTIALVSLLFGALYYLAAWRLDRSGRHGVAVAFVATAVVPTLTGLATLAPDLHRAGTGAAFLVAGLLIALYGSRHERRFTTWFWGLAAVGGAIAMVTEVADGSVATLGVGLMVLGAVVVAAAWAMAHALGEQDDMTPRSADVTAVVGGAHR